MNEDEAQRLRERIQHDQTSCRCGHLLAACADCRDWLAENSLRIAMSLESWWRCVHEYQDILAPSFRVRMAEVDATEADDRAFFGL